MVTAGRKNEKKQPNTCRRTHAPCCDALSKPSRFCYTYGEVAGTEKASDIASIEESPNATCGNQLCALTFKAQRKQNTLYRDVVVSKTIVNRRQKGDVLFMMCC